MKSLTACNTLFVAVLFCLAATSCSKDVSSKQNALCSTTEASSVASSLISNATDPNGFLGEYTVRDERTVYQGQANPKGTNVFIHLSYLDVKKTITSTADKKHLTMPYGPSNYADSGWAYIIDYDKTTKTVTLSPNKAMLKGIVQGSFKVLSAVYDPKTKEGSFSTRFTALSDKGNETQVSESFWKE